jgi:hypothetical protein
MCLTSDLGSLYQSSQDDPAESDQESNQDEMAELHEYESDENVHVDMLEAHAKVVHDHI